MRKPLLNKTLRLGISVAAAGALAAALAVGCGRAGVTAPVASSSPRPSTSSGSPDSAADEHLGPRHGTSGSGTHPLTVLMYAQKSTPRQELLSVHPRVLVDERGLAELRRRAKTTHRETWQRTLKRLRVLNEEPAPPPAQERRVQNVVGIGIAEAALAYAIEGDLKYLQAAKKWMDVATSYEVWGYTYNKPDVDLAAGHLLYGMGIGYDLLHSQLSEAERSKYRDKLVRQARLMYAHYQPAPGMTVAYSQNHVYIPAAGLSTTAYALYGEVEEARDWARLSRAVLGRSLDTYSADGYFYEGFEYFVFSVPWLINWVTIHEQVTGEALWDRPGFRHMHEYLAHSILPDGVGVFDFGDAYSGADTRLKKTADLSRTHPGGQLHNNYNLLHATARWFRDPRAQGVAAAMQKRGDVTWFEYMSLLWYDPGVPATPLSEVPTTKHFADHGVAFYRSGWGQDAVALAFKCGPPEGYSAQERLRQFPDWHLSSGHAHPDAGSFILYGAGRYLTGDSGYSGVPNTDQDNTLLVDGRGQRSRADGHNAFHDVPYARLAQIKLQVKRLDSQGVDLVGQLEAAYPPELGVEKLERRLTLAAANELVITDRAVSSAPRRFTLVFHADQSIDSVSGGSYAFENGQLHLFVEQPANAKMQIEPNWMTGPGRPGSVQKGAREARGVRLLVEGAAPTRTFEFKTRFVIRPQTDAASRPQATASEGKNE